MGLLIKIRDDRRENIINYHQIESVSDIQKANNVEERCYFTVAMKSNRSHDFYYDSQEKAKECREKLLDLLADGYDYYEID